MSVLDVGTETSPWNHLEFWKRFHQIPKAWLEQNFTLVPFKLFVRGLAVDFENFSRPFNPTGTVCRGQFDMSAFTRTVLVM
jgi:hypothetical protein